MARIQSLAVQREIATLRDAELVEYERVYSLEAPLPEAAVPNFPRNEWRDSTARAAELKQYIEREGDLLASLRRPLGARPGHS